MSTHCIIARRNKDGSYDVITCHFDGYPAHMAPTLLENYGVSDLVQTLLDLGDLEWLGQWIGYKHTYDEHHDRKEPNPRRNWCLACSRDLGETGTEAERYANGEVFEEALRKMAGDWLYLWDETEQKWIYASMDGYPYFVQLAAWKEMAK